MPTLNRQESAQSDVPASLQVAVVPGTETTVSLEKAVLPVALRDTEITEGDVETLLRVLKDKKAPAGRYLGNVVKKVGVR